MILLGFERDWLLVVFDSIVPSGTSERVPTGAKDAPMDRFLSDLFASAPLHFCLGLKACLYFVMVAPLFVLGRWSTFLGLSSEERHRLLDRLAESDVYVIREMPLLFKTVACLGFCGLPEVQSRIGITPVDATPPEWARRGLPLLAERR
ncbi:MAG TPA: hypothetical protein VHE30_18410 [Polyangiaceae bacterium]|nr:hypothetical protein [Polyangiaceae bacterium]